MSPADCRALEYVFLMPGAVHVAARPTLVTTVLGSCVSVCVWDPVLRSGGINHFVLPRDFEGRRGTHCGDVAVRELLSGMRALGSRPTCLRAKVFGGAAVLNIGQPGTSVGEQNVRIALDWLHRERIPVVAQVTGGSQGLRICFDTASGGELLRRLPGTNSDLAG
jgi:chemotaxis protein CheD